MDSDARADDGGEGLDSNAGESFENLNVTLMLSSLDSM
jgi:hypothetical protein